MTAGRLHCRYVRTSRHSCPLAGTCPCCITAASRVLLVRLGPGHDLRRSSSMPACTALQESEDEAAGAVGPSESPVQAANRGGKGHGSAARRAQKGRKHAAAADAEDAEEVKA